MAGSSKRFCPIDRHMREMMRMTESIIMKGLLRPYFEGYRSDIRPIAGTVTSAKKGAEVRANDHVMDCLLHVFSMHVI